MFHSNTFQKKLLISIGGLYLLFAASFSAYQYQRERFYKTDIMHSRLQMYAYEMMQTLGRDSLLDAHAFDKYLKRHNLEGLRITIINTQGRVLLDSHEHNTDSMGNHLMRAEIQQALINGNGYDIKRTSASTNETYFYSATRFGDIIIRAATPYSAELTRTLKADPTYLYFAIALTILLGIVLYTTTHRIGKHISCLREFAKKAEEGTPLDHELERSLPDDELGDISHTIIQLYWKLRHSEEDKQRLKRQLTQNAAHELKTPAASIHGYLESILDHPDMTEDTRQHFLIRCYAQSQRMNKLLLDMAQLTKLDECPTLTSQYHKRTLIDVVPIVHSVIDDLSLQLEEKHITCKLHLPTHIIIESPLAQPEDTIYSIFRNLTDNALAYATGATQITITYDQGTFTFADNGCGVSPEHLPHLFERFYRVDKGRSRKLGGTGLGLAIVKNAVNAHHGTITAQSTPEGQGLSITFTLESRQ